MFVSLHAMINYYTNLLFRISHLIVFAFLLTSCINLPVHEAKQKGEQTDDKFSGFYNREHKLVYDVYRDTTNIYLQVSTSTITTQVKMLKLGFTVWMDPSGKKNKDRGFIYPPQTQSLKRSQDNRQGKDKNNNVQIIKGENPRQEAAFSRKLMREYKTQPSELILMGFNGTNSRQAYRPKLQETLVDVSINMDSMGTMLYEASIPIDTILANANDSTFSLGLVSGAIEFDNDENMDDTGADVTQGGGLNRRGGGVNQRGRRGRGGVTPGRQRPGQVGSRGGRGQRQQTTSLSEKKQELSTPINVWFKVDLKTE